MKETKIRFAEEEYETLRRVADEHNMSLASVARMTVTDSLRKYLGSVRYVDQDQARDINDNICKFANLLVDIRDQIRRIGINYNQIAKIKNIERKIAEVESEETLGAFSLRLKNRRLEELRAERDELSKSGEDVNLDHIDALLDRLNEISLRMEEVLCLIQT